LLQSFSLYSNDWSPFTPSPAVALLDTWQNLLPAFLYDNILDQLILPKLNKAIAEWKPPSRSSSANSGTEKPASLQGMVFPWLPFLGERMEEVLGEAKRKIRGMMKGWKVQDKVPDELRKWKDVSRSGHTS
jgi:tuftelin-interacting protein 11